MNQKSLLHITSIYNHYCILLPYYYILLHITSMMNHYYILQQIQTYARYSVIQCAYHMPGFAQSEFKAWNMLGWVFGYVGHQPDGKLERTKASNKFQARQSLQSARSIEHR
jgi:hypothetical protein